MTFLTKLAASYEILAEGSKADETAKAIEEAFKKVFPKSLVKATFKTNLGAAVTVVFSLVADLGKLPNGIRDNDPAYSVWQIWGFNKDGSGAQVKAELTRGGSYNIKPEAGSHMAMSSVKLGWRNKTGTPEQIAKHFADYATKSKKIMEDNVANTYGDEKQIAIYKDALGVS